MATHRWALNRARIILLFFLPNIAAYTPCIPGKCPNFPDYSVSQTVAWFGTFFGVVLLLICLLQRPENAHQNDDTWEHTATRDIQEFMQHHDQALEQAAQALEQATQDHNRAVEYALEHSHHA
ncbi:hypothetical protein FB451DRAFT_1284742 [Mycena latifolia]|nr:hypothetical protein FB451DRAFT_1284742 [Mycena latifolia]